jgi:hypothetical protein
MSYFSFLTRSFIFISATALITPCSADHGPGTSAGGFSAQTAETLKQKQWSAAVYLDWTEFDSVDASQLGGLDHFDLLDRSVLTTFGASVGVTDNFQIGISFGYYTAEGSRRIPHGHHEDEVEGPHGSGEEEHAGEETEHFEQTGLRQGRGRRFGTRHANHGGDEIAEKTSGEHEEEPHATAEESSERDLASFDPDGWTDLWLTAKYRLYRGPAGQLAVFGGIKFPVGETRVIDSTGERVEPASTPGTGAWDEMIGLAYTFSATPDLSLDASAQYIFRGEKFDYRLGNRFDASVAASWRVFGKGDSFPQVALLAEASVRHIEKSEERGIEEDDTGGTAIFLSPGFRIGFSPNASWTAGVQFPVSQELNGNQLETRFRFTTSLSVSF